jgi:bacillithiol system protein YtxJ
MNWIDLNSKNQLASMIESSKITPHLVFKHSTRCFISKSVLSNFEKEWNLPDSTVILVFLDLLAHREISNEIEKIFNVRHESPQALLIRDGKVVYSASHENIDVDDISTHLT